MTDEPSTVLVTGAMGQVGKRLTELLLSRGRAVVALDLANEVNAATAAALTPAPGKPGVLAPAYVDLTDREAVRAVVEAHQPEAIVHLAAAIPPACYRATELARRVNVEGTENLVAAACASKSPPAFVEASSSAVHGPRNPHRKLGRLTADTPIDPIDCYGEHKAAAEQLVLDSGLRSTVLRLGGILSPDGSSQMGPDIFLLMRAMPRDGRIHFVDARDAALAFANAVDRIDAVQGRVMLIGGDESCVHTHAGANDDTFEASGLGHVGPSIQLPGDPNDDRGWWVTDWFDTVEAEEILCFQQHSWYDTLDWLAASQGRRRTVMKVAGPLARPALRGYLALQRRREHRGQYADPWSLVSATYGPQIFAGSSGHR